MVRSIGTANRIISQYGAGALYTGVGLTSMRCAVGNFAYFGLYEFLQRTDASERTVAKNGVYGALAGTAYFPDLRGTLLFLEDVNETIYRNDRMLTTLGEQPQKIMAQMQEFSKDFEAALQYTRE